MDRHSGGTAISVTQKMVAASDSSDFKTGRAEGRDQFLTR
jgi:hypothetical protein